MNNSAFENTVTDMARVIRSKNSPNDTFWFLVDGHWVSGQFTHETEHKPEEKSGEGDAIELFNVSATLANGQVVTQPVAVFRLNSISAMMLS